MSHQRYTPEFKDEAVRKVTEKGHSVQEVAAYLFVNGRSPLVQSSSTRKPTPLANPGANPATSWWSSRLRSRCPSGGGDGGDQGGFNPITSNQYFHKLSDRWRLGMSLLSISGVALNPRNDWAGRNEIAEVSLFNLTLLL